MKPEKTYLKKAEQHGTEVAWLVAMRRFDDAVSHARLAASHARRALSILEQLEG
jgi:hypothetical protein